MKPLTVVQMLPALESGGVERGTLEVGKFLVEQGHRSIVISAGGRMVEQLIREGSEHVAWNVGRKSLISLLRHVPRLRQFLRDEHVDILHVRSRMPAWVGYLAWKSIRAKARPHFITTVHGLYSVNPYSAVMTKGETVIAVSNTVRDYILANYPETDRSRIVVIPRGIDPTQYPHAYHPPEKWLAAWRAQYPQLIGRKVLTLPGRITRLKGHEDFIELIARLKGADLPVHGLIVGGAEAKKQAYLAELEAEVIRLGLADHITFTGQRGDLREIMAVSDIVLSLSTQPESFGRTVLEALKLGRPVVGYDHGGVGEQLAASLPTGRVPVGDIATVAERAIAWLDAPPAIPEDQQFTLRNMLRSTLGVYEHLS